MSVRRDGVAVLTIGDELLSGEIADRNLQVIARSLAGMGLSVRRHVTVPDDVRAIADETRALAAGHHAVVITGGLGPTSDDLTTEAVAKAAGVELVFHPHLEENLKNFFVSMGRVMARENLKQAYLPAGAVEIPTDGGTAPGFMIQIEGAMVAVLPGVPWEMERMLNKYVIEEMRKRFTGERISITRRIMTFGTGESDVAALVGDLIDRGPVKYGFLVMGGPIVVKLTTSGATREEALALLDAEQEKVLDAIGDLFYAIDDKPIEDVMGEMLLEEGMTIAAAESLTAGMVSSRIANTPGSSSYFLGGVVAYSNLQKQRILRVDSSLLQGGAVSVRVAEAMAAGARELFGSDIGISTTGVAGPGAGGERKPVGTVAIGLSYPDGATSFERRLPGGRAMVRNIATMAALNTVRLHLLERRSGPGRGAR